jgi:hypothetical protein
MKDILKKSIMTLKKDINNVALGRQKRYKNDCVMTPKKR